MEIARLAVEEYPRSSRVHRTLGVMLRRTGDEKAARARFLQAIQVEQQSDQPDSERIMDVRLQLWLMDQEANILH